MNLWLVSNIAVDPRRSLEASAIQNIQTAMALAEQGHTTLLWVARMASDGRAALREHFGRALPDGLRILACRPKGRSGEKRTAFSAPAARLRNILRARLRAPAPEAIIARSPLVLAQLRKSWLVSSRAKLILEFQYPEWALLWRGWRRKHPEAGPAECVKRLRQLRQEENERLLAADGILYASRGHEPLLRRIQFSKPVQWLPSACLPPDDRPPVAPEYDAGYVGRLSPENGLETVLAALREVAGLRFYVVGDGPESYKAQLRRLTEELGLSNRVVFAGAVKHSEVRSHMRLCRIGLVPISARRGPEKRQFASPLKLVEWMAAGAPVVASAVPSVSQHVCDGREAALFRPDSPQDLAAAIRRVLDSPSLQRALRENGLEAARKSSYPNRARQIIDFIERIPCARRRGVLEG